MTARKSWSQAYNYYGPQPSPTSEWWNICEVSDRQANEGTYQAGCRCPVCREAHRLYAKYGPNRVGLGGTNWSADLSEPLRTVDNPYGRGYDG